MLIYKYYNMYGLAYSSTCILISYGPKFIQHRIIEIKNNNCNKFKLHLSYRNEHAYKRTKTKNAHKLKI